MYPQAISIEMLRGCNARCITCPAGDSALPETRLLGAEEFGFNGTCR